MATYRRVYDSHHLQADSKNRDQLRNLRSVIKYGLPYYTYWRDMIVWDSVTVKLALCLLSETNLNNFQDL